MLRQGDHAPLLLVLVALLAVILATASAAARRRMRRRGAFAGGAVLGGVAACGLLGLGALVLWGPEETRRVVRQLASNMPSLPAMGGHESLREVAPTPRMPAVIRPAPRPPADRMLRGLVTHVRDGDTIVVGETPIRFTDVNCAESGTALGERASEAMRRIASGRAVSCSLIGRRSYDREIGTCFFDADGRDVGGVLVTMGLCTRWTRADQ